MPWEFFVSPTQSPLCLSDARCQNESSAYRRITHASFSNNCYYQISGAAVVAELAEVDSLPCAEVQTAIGDGDGDADTAQCRFGVSRHIVGTFQRMLILRTIFGHEAVEDGFHIHANIGIAVLVDAQSAAGVLREDVHDARLRQFRQLAHYLARHQMESTTFRLQGYFNLLYHNGCKGTNKPVKYQIYLSISEQECLRVILLKVL